MVKSYGQYCAVARALDVIGDRWTPLIVRELLLGPCRYSELLESLPGIATNLLADRLRSLEEHGVAERDESGNYRLTKWGEGLREPLHALARWAAPLMVVPAGDDFFRGPWLAHPVSVLFPGVDRKRADMTIEVDTDGDPVTIQSRVGKVTVRPRPTSDPDIILRGPPDAVVGLLSGILDVESAKGRGLSIQGDARRIAGLRPIDLSEGQPASQS